MRLSTEQLRQALERLTETSRRAAKQALRREAERIMTDSKRNYVPVDEGTLRRSGHVEDVSEGVNGGTARFALTYGGAASAYALAVHEHPGPYDPPSWRAAGESDRLGATGVTFHPSGHGPKYLERPFYQAAPQVLQRIAERLGVQALMSGEAGGADESAEGEA